MESPSTEDQMMKPHSSDDAIRLTTQFICSTLRPPTLSESQRLRRSVSSTSSSVKVVVSSDMVWLAGWGDTLSKVGNSCSHLAAALL